MRSEGIELQESGKKEPDPYMLTRHQPQYAYTTPSTYDKLKQFLEMDRKVLRFYCIWDDRDNMFGELKPHVSGDSDHDVGFKWPAFPFQIIHYFLADDTIEIREVHEPNDGRDPFPVLLCRQKLAKNPNDIPSRDNSSNNSSKLTL